MKRRAFITSSATLLAACDWVGMRKQSQLDGGFLGGFIGASHTRGHLLRERKSFPATEERKTTVAIVGAGISGLAAARALSRAGINDYQLFELEDAAGGNSRGGAIEGIAHPLGAHYLPTPSAEAREVRELLAELKLLSVVDGKDVYPEANLCHSPQERLLASGTWQEGLLPGAASSSASAQYLQFSQAVQQWQNTALFAVPSQTRPLTATVQALDRQSFDSWLQAQGFTDPQLRWYLDYCCRDDYGAGSAVVSAWAGIHYFASRHGFHPPGAEEKLSDSGVLTWPEGNGWLSARLAEKYANSHLQSAVVVSKIEPSRNGVTFDVINTQTQTRARWRTEQLICCIPLFIADKLIEPSSIGNLIALKTAAKQVSYASWTVANIYLPEPPRELPGFPRSWDNVVYGSAGLGYVDAMHQSTIAHENHPTVLTHYSANGTSPEARKALYSASWKDSATAILKELSAAHPDIEKKAKRVDIMRYGHAMASPTPGLRSSEALAALTKPAAGDGARLHFAHSDLSAYSVFEEAFTWGTRVGAQVARLVKGSAALL